MKTKQFLIFLGFITSLTQSRAQYVNEADSIYQNIFNLSTNYYNITFDSTYNQQDTIYGDYYIHPKYDGSHAYWFANVNPKVYLDSSGQNIWQIGQPQKSFFDSAWSAPNALVTDTVNTYPSNNTSYFYLNNTYTSTNIWFCILHKYDTDTLKDGGYIEVSRDSGATWINILYDTTSSSMYDVTPGRNFYYNCTLPNSGSGNVIEATYNFYCYDDTLYNGQTGFSGNSGGWVYSSFTWHYTPVKSNNVDFPFLLRFTFISDSIDNNKEGWLIDNIGVFYIDLGTSVQEHKVSNMKVSPNPVKKNQVIRIQAATSSFSDLHVIIYDVSGKKIGIQRFNGNILEYSTEKLPAGIYFLKLMSGNQTLGQQKFVVQ